MCKCEIRSTAPEPTPPPAPPERVLCPECNKDYCICHLINPPLSPIIAELYSKHGMEKFKDAVVEGTKVLRDEEMRELILALQKALCVR